LKFEKFKPTDIFHRLKKALMSKLLPILFLLANYHLCIAQTPQVSSGKVIRIENFNSQFVKPRNVDIWLPEGYQPKKKYAVLYMHDGQMLFDSTATWNKQEWKVDETIGKLIAEKKIKECIVVGIWSTELRHAEYFPQKPFESLPKNFRDSLIENGKRNEGTPLFRATVQSDNYLKFIVLELKPYIDKTYSTKSDKKNTFIAGSSMGGLISMYAVCEYPNVFGAAACLSTHWPGTFTVTNNPIPDAFINYLKNGLPNPKSNRIYFDFGTATLDNLYEPLQNKVDEVMRAKGFTNKNWTTLKFEGADHSERAWAKRLANPLQFLLKK
jgi:enterochelin esterase-like enzyme